MANKKHLKKRYARLAIIFSLLWIALNVTCVFADNSLDDLTGGKASTDSSGGLLKGLNDSVDFSEENDIAAKAKEPLKEAFGVIVQIGSYVLAGGVVAITVLDLIYVCIPPFQPFLSGGEQGMPQQGGQQGMPGASGMGGMGGMSGMGMGGMGMGGMGRYGGMGGGMGMGGMGMQGQQPMQGSGHRWVTRAALNAVASSSMPDATGKPMHPLKIYSKSSIYTLIMAMVLLSLTVTGVLGKLGFAIGELIGGLIQSVITML